MHNSITIEGSLVHLHMRRNIVFMSNTSDHGEFEHDRWQNLRGEETFCLIIELSLYGTNLNWAHIRLQSIFYNCYGSGVAKK